MTTTTYGAQFFAEQQGAILSARKVLPRVVGTLRAHSVIDVGCGVGVWAHVAGELGCDASGIDGDWVPRDQLLISTERFGVVDLTNPPAMSRTFNLAICLEVAEHLPGEAAERFVGFLTTLAPVILFSAAVPFQQGTHHVNEQQASYWVRLFAAKGFEALDVIRPALWNDPEVAFYYRQNTLLYVRSASCEDVREKFASSTVTAPVDIIHPEAIPILAQGWVESMGAAQCFTWFVRAVARAVRKRFPRQ